MDMNSIIDRNVGDAIGSLRAWITNSIWKKDPFGEKRYPFGGSGISNSSREQPSVNGGYIRAGLGNLHRRIGGVSA